MRETLTLVLVEDEPLILDELLAAINWQALGLEVTGTATDGEAGESLIKTLNPDIVITDIRLPKKTGLEMIKACPLLSGNVIILSGYTDFEYTRSAIKLGVFDYLEKPFEDEELEAILKTLSERIREEHQEERKLKGKEDDKIPLPEKVDNYQVNCVLRFLSENYMNQISLSDAAAEVNLTGNHLSTLFKEATGLGYLQYLQALRINKALELMREKDLNISQIALRTGFSDPGYFARIFKTFTGKSPKNYRDKL